MSGIPAYDGPSQALGTFQGQVLLQALALSGLPPAPVTVSSLAPFLLPLPLGGVNWQQDGGAGGLSSLVTLYGEIVWPLDGLPGPAQIFAAALVGDLTGDYPVTVIALPAPLAVSPGRSFATLQIVATAFGAQTGGG